MMTPAAAMAAMTRAGFGAGCGNCGTGDGEAQCCGGKNKAIETDGHDGSP
jgi:hypothetical protein